MKKTVAIFCGGSSYEHEVSIVTGIQVVDAMDKSKYIPVLVYFDKNNKPHVIDGYKTKRDFNSKKHLPVQLLKGDSGLYIKQSGAFSKSIAIDVVYLAFHGGMGESGHMQGMLEYLSTPFTGPAIEGAVISMNKSVTKEVLHANSIPQLPWKSVTKHSLHSKFTEIQNELTYPLIIKPVHLGSSIGISVVNSDIELEQQLKLALQIDTEVLVEPALKEFTEYNVSVRTVDGQIECSPIEEPVKKDQTLSFEDKYENGAKKSGGAGMESLDRTLPAKISNDLELEIKNLANRVYQAARLSGLVRIDFLYSEQKLYCSEINPIPGSMSFYLWEAAGEQFEQQITQSIEDAIVRKSDQIQIEPYETDIVQKYINS